MMIVNDATSWSITLELSMTLLESSTMLLVNIYSTGITHYERHMTIVMCLWHMPLVLPFYLLKGLYYKALHSSNYCRIVNS
jgi:hypothetical protein